MTGDATAGTSTFSMTLPKCTASVPDATQVAPIRPPNSACDELDGSPAYQVTRFQTIAPISPPKITAGLILVSSTMPPEIVFATSMDRNAPTRLRPADSMTATFGRNAPVAMDVAIAFAVSWKPLVKSNANAVTITTITSSVGSTLILRVGFDLTSTLPGGTPRQARFVGRKRGVVQTTGSRGADVTAGSRAP